MPGQEFHVAGRAIGAGQSCFVIAEAGVNHNGELKLAHSLVDVAAAAGADAVKFQTFRADALVTKDAAKAEHQFCQACAGESQYEMLRRLELSADDHRELMEHARARGIVFLSTPFDEPSADLLEELGVVAFKIPSGEIPNLPYMAYLARKGKPLIVSTGMASLGEVEAAVLAIEETGHDDFALLHCVSNYPADPANVNLRAMETLAAAFGRPIGYSDHTIGIEVALGAVALGACIVEKHFTLSRSLPGPDHAASCEPSELEALIRGIRKVQQALGDGRKRPAERERATADVARKSLVAARNIPAGTTLTFDAIAVKRPGTGLPPALRSSLVGRTTRMAIPDGALLTLDMLT